MSDDTTTLEEKTAYLREMIDTRGYVLDYHKVLVSEDLRFMKGVNGLFAAAYVDEGALSKKVKELLFVVLMTAVGAPKDVIKIHVDLAEKAGWSKAEVLQALEMSVLPCGMPKFFAGYEAWTEVFDVERIEPD